jgi:hypothetical protein
LRFDDHRFLISCLDVGVHGDMVYQEFPPYKWQPILDGMMSTAFFEKRKGYRYLTLFSSKMILQIQDFVGGEISTRMQRDITNVSLIRMKYTLRF